MKPIRIDWQRVALNIRRSGVSLAQVSQKCGRDHSWLGHIARGDVTRVEFHDGLRLLDFHFDTCGADAHRALLEHAK